MTRTPAARRSGTRRRPRARDHRVLLIVLVASLFVARPPGWALPAARAQAQAEGAAGADAAAPPAAPDEDAARARSRRELERLAREFTDPLTSLPQLFVQDAYTPVNYGTDAPGNRVIVRAILPRVPRFTLLPFVQLVRPSLSLVTVPTGRGSATRTEFGDMQLFDAFVMPRVVDGLTIGVGPTFVFPTATHRTAGQGAWQVGPLFATLYKGVPWLLVGCLAQNPISFAYTSDDREPVSALLFQPLLLVALPGGWYVKSADATWVINWRRGTSTLLPLSFGIGRVLVRDDMPPINFYVSGEWMAYRQFAPVAPQTTVRFGMTVAFPEFRPW